MNLLYPIVSGLLTAFSFSSDKNAFLVFLSLIPLFHSIRKTKRKFLYMFIYASVLHLTSVSWIVNATEFLPFEKEKNFIFLLLFLIVIAVAEGVIIAFPFIFWEKLYKYGDQWGAELKESTETIAGKKCVVFTAPDGTVVAGWNRVLFKSDEFTAVSWSDNVSSDAFSVDKYNIMEY